MTFVFLLICRACGGYARITVQGSACPGHIHLHVDDPVVQTWWGSHLMPGIQLEGVLP